MKFLFQVKRYLNDNIGSYITSNHADAESAFSEFNNIDYAETWYLYKKIILEYCGGVIATKLYDF